MTVRYGIIGFILLALSVIAACTTSKEISVELANARVKVPGITADQLITGRKIYIMNCASCHALNDPAKYTTAQWAPILTKMFAKAKITDSTRIQLITNYVMAKSK